MLLSYYWWNLCPKLLCLRFLQLGLNTMRGWNLLHTPLTHPFFWKDWSFFGMLRISRQPGYWICGVYVASPLSAPSHIRIHEAEGFEISKTSSIQYAVVTISSLSLPLLSLSLSLSLYIYIYRNGPDDSIKFQPKYVAKAFFILHKQKKLY